MAKLVRVPTKKNKMHKNKIIFIKTQQQATMIQKKSIKLGFLPQKKKNLVV